MENFVDQTISKAEKHKYEVVTNLGVDDIRNAFDFRSKKILKIALRIFGVFLNAKKLYCWLIWKFCFRSCNHSTRKPFIPYI